MLLVYLWQRVEQRFPRDVLYELASVGELPLPPTDTPGPSRKRTRETETENDTENEEFSAPLPYEPELATLSTSPNGGVFNPPNLGYQNPYMTMLPMNALPLHSDELGRLPLHPQFAAPSIGVMPEPQPIASTSAPGAIVTETGAYSYMPTYPQQPLPNIAPIPSSSSEHPLAEVPLNPVPNQQSPFPAPPSEAQFYSVPDDQVDQDTLAMWSTAPTSFE